MKKAAILILGILTLLASTSLAETEIGFSGQMAWSNHFSLNDPAGYSIFARQSLSEKLRLQLQYGYFSESKSYLDTIHSSFIYPMEEDLIDNFSSKAWAHTFELALLYNLIDYKLLRLNVGGGLNLTFVDANAQGIETGFGFPDPYSEKLGLSFLADISLQYSYNLPLVFHIGFRGERTNSTTLGDDRYKMDDNALNFTELKFGISYRFLPYSR